MVYKSSQYFILSDLPIEIFKKFCKIFIKKVRRKTMTEENNNQEINTDNPEKTNKKGWTDGNEETLKCVLVWAAAFLGGFFAVMLTKACCMPFDRTMPPPPFYEMDAPFHHHKHFMPEGSFEAINENFEIKDFEKGNFDKKFEGKMAKKKLPNANPIGHPPFNPVVNMEEMPDKYKITVNLRRFNNDEKNIKIDIKSHSVKISGTANTNTKEEQSSFSYSKSFTVSKKIDADNIKKEVVGNRLIITAPLED